MMSFFCWDYFLKQLLHRRKYLITLWISTLLLVSWKYGLSTTGGSRAGWDLRLWWKISRSSGFHGYSTPLHPIPSKIWQIPLPKHVNLGSDDLNHSTTWLALNPGYAYTLVDFKRGREFVEAYFKDEPSALETYDTLPLAIMKSDFLRYLLLYAEGGVYSDLDTVALKPIDGWVPERFRGKVRLIVGIEYDRRDDAYGWADISHWVQFSQWTIAAAADHPVLRNMVARVLNSVEDLSSGYKDPMKELDLSAFNVLNTTGPAAWTDVVFEHIKEYEPSLMTTADLSFMTDPKLYGDILVLPIDGFGMGQLHSNSTRDGSVPEDALAKHLFRGSWKEEWP